MHGKFSTVFKIVALLCLPLLVISLVGVSVTGQPVQQQQQPNVDPLLSRITNEWALMEFASGRKIHFKPAAIQTMEVMPPQQTDYWTVETVTETDRNRGDFSSEQTAIGFVNFVIDASRAHQPPPNAR